MVVPVFGAVVPVIAGAPLAPVTGVVGLVVGGVVAGAPAAARPATPVVAGVAPAAPVVGVVAVPVKGGTSLESEEQPAAASSSTALMRK